MNEIPVFVQSSKSNNSTFPTTLVYDIRFLPVLIASQMSDRRWSISIGVSLYLHTSLSWDWNEVPKDSRLAS